VINSAFQYFSKRIVIEELNKNTNANGGKSMSRIISIALPDNLFKRIDKEAKESHTPRNRLITNILNRVIESNEDETKIKRYQALYKKAEVKELKELSGFVEVQNESLNIP